LLITKTSVAHGLYRNKLAHTLLEEKVLYRTLKGSKALRTWNPLNAMRVNDHKIQNMGVKKMQLINITRRVTFQFFSSKNQHD